MCEIDWAELRSWAQPSITALGIIVSVLLAIYIPRHQKNIDRSVYANVASRVLGEAFARTCDRLAIRFDPPSYGRTGRKMRRYRADGAFVTLLDLKVGELPVAVIASFGAARSGLRAINEAMNNEANWPPSTEEVERYRVVFDEVQVQKSEFNQKISELGIAPIELPPASFSRPTTPEPDLEQKSN